MINGWCFLLLILSRVVGISFVVASIVSNYIPDLPIPISFSSGTNHDVVTGADTHITVTLLSCQGQVYRGGDRIYNFL